MAYDADSVDSEQHRPAGLLRVEPLGVDEEFGAENLAGGAALGVALMTRPRMSNNEASAPSRDLRATLPVKPSVTITSTSPFNRSGPPRCPRSRPRRLRPKGRAPPW